jgi:hypothetical protein
MHAVRPLLLLAAFLSGTALAPAPEGTGALVTPARPMPRAEPRPDAGPPPRPGPAGVGEPADPMDTVGDPETLLRLAEAMAASGQLDRAGELLERALTRLLTRSEAAERIAQPVTEGVVGVLNEARAAIAAGDAAAAAGRIRVALRRLEEARTPLEERVIR